jgi:hypothetical protein
MPKNSIEQVKLYQVRLGTALAKVCDTEATAAPHHLPPSVFLRRICEDYFTLYGLPRSQFVELEADRKARKLDKREYFKVLLDDRLRILMAERQP